jgi:hypothetical protein
MTSPTIRAIVKAMRAAGCPAEQIVEAVCAYEDDADAREAERRAKDRDRKRAERAKSKTPASEPVQAVRLVQAVQPVQRTSRTDADNADSADKPVSPPPSPKVSPKDNNQTPFLTPNLPPFSSRERAGIARNPAEKQEGGEGFAAFWRAMPAPDPAAKAAAQAAFARLDPADQTQAIAAAGRYASTYAAKPTTRPISPARFLRERCFEGYGPPSPAAEASSVFVRLDTPQWRAWTAYRGKPIPLNREGTGWHFPTEWPPEAERGAA